MKTTRKTPLGVLALLFVSTAGAQEIQWKLPFHETVAGRIDAVDTVDPGAIYVAGAIGQDVFVARVDDAGGEAWQDSFGSDGGGPDAGTAVSADTGGVYVAGWLRSLSSAFVRRYHADGNEAWTREFSSGSTTQALAVAGSSDGVYVAGRTNDALPGQSSASPGLPDGFIRKYDSGGGEAVA